MYTKKYQPKDMTPILHHAEEGVTKYYHLFSSV